MNKFFKYFGMLCLIGIISGCKVDANDLESNFPMETIFSNSDRYALRIIDSKKNVICYYVENYGGGVNAPVTVAISCVKN